MKRFNNKILFYILILFFFGIINSFADNTEELVDIKTLAPGIIVEMPYATVNNFTGVVLYPVNRALLKKLPAEALVRVQKKLESQNLCLKIWDAYRPHSVQEYMWTILPDSRYVADPKTGSKHNRGAAVDVTLTDKNGKELEMPTKFDDFSEKASRLYKGNTPIVQKNSKILEDIMISEGFVPYEAEWWHFDYNGWEKYDVLDIPLTEDIKSSK